MTNSLSCKAEGSRGHVMQVACAVGPEEGPTRIDSLTIFVHKY